MGEPKYTPGPWTIRHGWNVFGPDGRLVANARGAVSGSGGQQEYDRTIANARLIAAVPDYDLAAKVAEDAMYYGFIPPEGVSADYEKGWMAACRAFKESAARDTLCAAISKGRGES